MNRMIPRLFRASSPLQPSRILSARSYFQFERTSKPSYSCHTLPSGTQRRAVSQWGPVGPRRTPRYNRFNRAQRLYSLWYTSPAFRYGIGAIGVAGGSFYYMNLERVPISGRLRFNCISPAYEEQLSQRTLQAVLQEFRGKVLPPSHPYSKLVNRVIARLIPAAGLEGSGWEIRVINDREQKNAFVIPGFVLHWVNFLETERMAISGAGEIT